MRILEAIWNFLSNIKLKKYHNLIYCSSLTLIYGISKYFHIYYTKLLKAIRLQCKPYISPHYKKELDTEIKNAERFKVIQGKFLCYITNPYGLKIDYSGLLMQDERNGKRDFYNYFSLINFREFRVEKLSWLARILYDISNVLVSKGSVNHSEKFLCSNDQVTALQDVSRRKFADFIAQGNIIYLIENLKYKVNFSKYSVDSSLILLSLGLIRELVDLVSSSILRFRNKDISSKVIKLQEANPEVLKLLSCHSCKNNIKKVINLSCGHFVLCYECFKLNKYCLLCKAEGSNHRIYA